MNVSVPNTGEMVTINDWHPSLWCPTVVLKDAMTTPRAVALLVSAMVVTIWVSTPIPIIVAAVLIVLLALPANALRFGSKQTWVPYPLHDVVHLLSPSSIDGIAALRYHSIKWKLVAEMVRDEHFRPLVEEALGIASATDNTDTPALVSATIDRLHSKFIDRLHKEPDFRDELADIVDRAH